MIRFAPLIALAALGVPADADPTAPAKKDRERAAKAPCKAALPVAGKPPAKLVNLYNSWTHEWLAVIPGELPPAATIDRFLRDHYTNEPAAMEPRLIELLVSAAQAFKSDTAFVISAFRHPKYNLILRKKGHQVARNSSHTKGNAVDFKLPRIVTKKLHAWAKRQAIGGVGLYLGSGFIHMDTGPVRYWSGE